MAVLLGAFTMSAEPVTVDFSTATNLPTTEAEEPSTATINGVDFTFVNCKQGKYQGATYLQISGKNHEGKAYMEFTAGFAVEKITMHTGTNASTNVTVQLYANDVAVGGALKLGEKDADFTIAVPAANQAAGTKYKLATSNKYNAQITTLTFNGDGSAVEPPVVETKKAANIGEFLKAADADNLTEITSTVTAVYRHQVHQRQHYPRWHHRQVPELLRGPAADVEPRKGYLQGRYCRHRRTARGNHR